MMIAKVYFESFDYRHLYIFSILASLFFFWWILRTSCQLSWYGTSKSELGHAIYLDETLSGMFWRNWDDSSSHSDLTPRFLYIFFELSPVRNFFRPEVFLDTLWHLQVGCYEIVVWYLKWYWVFIV